jgi:hypothetical protein
MAMKNSNDTIGNRTRDLPTCGAAPQRTAPPRAPTVPSIQQQKRRGRYVCSMNSITVIEKHGGHEMYFTVRLKFFFNGLRCCEYSASDASVSSRKTRRSSCKVTFIVVRL